MPDPKIDCVFCDIIAGQGPAEFVTYWDDAIAIIPRGKGPVHDPFGDGMAHVLVIPKVHVEDFVEDPEVAAAVARRVSQLAALLDGDASWNDITSAGAAATQTIKHFHRHLVRRVPGDGLHLPWTGQQVRS